ncbi:MAG: hypothetical protein K1000chlam4_00069 [Chlamydiae bacterium]|nr:hypothetical protein [Chlamydiota bacterium]
MTHFNHIPESEKKKEWFLLLKPLLDARFARDCPHKSQLIHGMNLTDETYGWKSIKYYVERCLKHATDGKSIFSRVKEIKATSNPDYIINDMFAELMAIPYLLQKGFTDLKYFRRNGVDFHVKYNGQSYYVEVTYVHGPNMKTFHCNPEPNFEGKNWDYSRKLINLLRNKYREKEAQILKKNLPLSNCIILIFTHLEETHEAWFKHAKIDGIHPILNFVITQKIATIVHGISVYEPEPTSLGGVFGKLNTFAWKNYSNQKF